MSKKERMGTDPLLDVIGGISKMQTDSGPEREQNVIDGKRIRLVPISQISPDPQQPRKHIAPDDPHIQELAGSIQKHGFINFISVVEVSPKKYVVVAGERRLTAAKVAGLEKIPVMIIAQEKSEVERALIQLEENLQREDLSPFEEADAYERLKSEFGLQQKDIVAMVKKPKSYVSQMLSIRKIAPEIQQDMQESETPVAKRVLWDLAGLAPEMQGDVWKKIKSDPTISNFEKNIKRLQKKAESQKAEKEEDGIDPELAWEALKWAVKKDKNSILSYISSKKLQKLVEAYSKEK